ncbi:hypothetical protein HW571_15565 [Agrobacterium genomosp. 3]|uniref:hypothetical protein n=1 Tax=Agrobacterium TaxID=357 RepID=UPI001571EEA0|nr:hypothetical protein [Agrobacterium tumefaciens]MCA1867103.1 hypothetical protein [Agrobacterium tomkonis]MCA1877455.1 hypothetical protein [Agrobacterium tumefaciens]MCA1890011.1 hypothetical protein [Agrobacterium tomkonis]NTE33433.1 hypothetical protein [Agrobacterium tumefaciens]NTE48943.1 hypothetical protein [Agrobacterium tumefaciens]
MRREVYERPKNEIEQQLARHNLEKDMAQDHGASIRPVSPVHIRRLRAERWGLIVFLVLVVGCVGLALGLS